MEFKKILIALSFVFISCIILAQSFNIYVSDAGNFNNPPWQILKYDQNGENPQVFIADNLAWPQDIVFLENENSVLISNLNSGRITRHNATTGAFIDDFATGIGGPTRMKIGSDDLLYILQWTGNGKVLRYNLNGTFMDEFTDTGVATSIGLDWDSAGNLYVSSYNGNTIRKFNSSGVDQGIFINSNIQGPTNIWFDPDGDLLVNNWNGGTVSRFDSLGNFEDIFIPGLNQPEGVDFMPNGNLLIGNGGTGAVKMYDALGNFIDDIVASGSGGLMQPNAVIVRITETSSLTDPSKSSLLLISNEGTQFYLTSDFSLIIKSIVVYDSLGKVVSRPKIQDHLIWDAREFSHGVYVIEAITKDEQVFSQKITVKK